MRHPPGELRTKCVWGAGAFGDAAGYVRGAPRGVSPYFTDGIRGGAKKGVREGHN